tara:strand:- start:201 stop:428 length:228 start_codon:yes stop_codon:yes gene_type:complete
VRTKTEKTINGPVIPTNTPQNNPKILLVHANRKRPDTEVSGLYSEIFYSLQVKDVANPISIYTEKIHTRVLKELV